MSKLSNLVVLTLILILGGPGSAISEVAASTTSVDEQPSVWAVSVPSAAPVPSASEPIYSASPSAAPAASSQDPTTVSFFGSRARSLFESYRTTSNRCGDSWYQCLIVFGLSMASLALSSSAEAEAAVDSPRSLKLGGNGSDFF